MNQLLEILKEDIRIDISRPAASLQGHTLVGQWFQALPHKQMRFEWMWLKDLPVIVAYLYQQPAWIMQLDHDGWQIKSIQLEVLGDQSLSPLDFLRATTRLTTRL